MTPGRWQEVKALLGDILDRPIEDRERFLAECPQADAEVKREVARLLASGPDIPSFLEPPSKDALEPPLRLISLAFSGCAIGDFQLIEEIGRGSSGVVYRAKQVSLGRPAAVKILAHHLCASDLARERFRREAEAASKLRHEAVVSVYACGEQSGACYIAMELVKGDTLRALLADRVAQKAGRAPSDSRACIDVSDPVVAARLVEKLARGLQHCHENHVVHRDVKPQNIVIDEHQRPRLIDFGLAKDCTLDDLTSTGALSGTPHYMSPEQAKVLGSAVDLRTDIYSLGVVLYELVTLQRPFETTAPGDLLHAIGHEEPRHIALVSPDAPAGLAAVCMKALAKRPEDRYPSAAAMADDLLRFLNGEATQAPKYALSQRVRDAARRHRGKVAAGVLVVSVGLFIGLRDARGTVEAAPPGPTAPAVRPVHEMRMAFERSIEGLDEETQTKRMQEFITLLTGLVRDPPEQRRDPPVQK